MRHAEITFPKAALSTFNVPWKNITRLPTTLITAKAINAACNACTPCVVRNKLLSNAAKNVTKGPITLAKPATIVITDWPYIPNIRKAGTASWYSILPNIWRMAISC